MYGLGLASAYSVLSMQSSDISIKNTLRVPVSAVCQHRDERKEMVMRFGCCGSLVATGADKTGVEIVERIAAMGYDYIELPLAEMMDLDDEAFKNLCARVEYSGIRCEVCNNFFPSRIRLTGSQVEMKAVEEYYCSAMDRAKQLGASVIVFGSAGAKRVPEGFPTDEAFEQLIDITKGMAAAAAKENIVIAIEPVRHPDCNIINTFEEGVCLAQKVNSAYIKVLVDSYHMACEHESPEVLVKYGKEYLTHIHFSYPNFPTIHGVCGPDAIRTVFENELHKKGWWRTYPSSKDEWNYEPFFSAVKNCGYNGRMSLEAPVEDFDRQAKQALSLLKSVF